MAAPLRAPRGARPRVAPSAVVRATSAAGVPRLPPARAAPPHRRASPPPLPHHAPHRAAAPPRQHRAPPALRATPPAASPHAPPIRAAPGRHPESLSKLARAFRANDGLVYMRNFFDAATFEEMRSECAALRPRLCRERSATAQNRLGLYLPASSAVTRAFAAPSVAARLSAVVGTPLFLADYPLELRSYPCGALMDWHRDESLYEVPQLELVLTISNTSDSATEWVDAEGQLGREWTEPNSLLAVRAGAALHRVTLVRRGARDIVKCVFAAGAAVRTAAFAENLNNTYL